MHPKVGEGPRDGQSAVFPGHKSAIYFPRAILEKDDRRVSSPRPSGKKIVANVHENAGRSREWRDVKLNEGGEEGEVGAEEVEEEEEEKKTRERERERSSPSFERSHNVTCERCLLSHNDEPVVDDAIMVGSRTCERADRKSRFPAYEDARSHADLRMGGPANLSYVSRNSFTSFSTLH